MICALILAHKKTHCSKHVCTRTKYSVIFRDKSLPQIPVPRISVVEKYVTEVDALPDRFLDAEILFLSHNSISSLEGFRQARGLAFPMPATAGAARALARAKRFVLLACSHPPLDYFARAV